MPYATRNGLATQRPVRARLAVEARPDQVPSARTFIGDVLGPRHPCVETALLLTSELVTNSVRHSACARLGQAIFVTAAVAGSGVRIEVSDRTGPTAPAVRATIDDHAAEGGRGLWLVHALAADWGYERDSDTTTTWFICTP